MRDRLLRIARYIPGLFVVGIGIWTLVVSTARVKAGPFTPGWIITLFGLAFLFGGVVLLIHFGPPGFRDSKIGGRIQGWAGAGILVCLITVSHWVAFGPGDRGSDSTVVAPIGSFTGDSGDWSTRIAFGIGAIVFDLILIRAIVHAIRKR